jgi:hypothetical protein
VSTTTVSSTTTTTTTDLTTTTVDIPTMPDEVQKYVRKD